jgi:LytS/YehU family sensor histidine kinase
MQSITQIKREKLYWIFQVSGWTGFFIWQTAVALYLTGFQWEIIAQLVSITVTGLVLTHLYREYIRRHRWSRLKFTKLAVRIILASFIVGTLWAIIVLPFNEYYFPIESNNQSTNRTIIWALINIGHLALVVFVWSTLYFIYQIFTSYQQSELEKWQLDSAVKDAELIALKSQINPHFIFNSLNNIRSLVTENPEKARDMITHLSGLLRYSIQFNNKARVSLEDELEIVQNYLNLESIQFEDRLQYKLEIKPETLELEIPPMAIQLLVENAIKHGISDLPDGGLINIRSFLQNDHLIVEVVNSGQLREGVRGTGIGLKNASDRLKLLFGKLSDLTIKNQDENHVSASFSIPINVTEV